MSEKIFRVDYYPSQAYLDFSNMSAEEVAVTIQISNLIYMRQGPIDYDVKWIARSFKDIGPAKCQKIILQLLQSGDLFLTEDGQISKKMCEKQLQHVRDRTKIAASHGAKGAETRWGNKQNQDDKNSYPIPPRIASTSTNISTSKEDPPLPPNGSQPAHRGTGVSKSVGEVDGQPFRIEHYLTDADREAARKAAPGWDLHPLFAKYDEGVAKRGTPRYPAKAFLGWLPKYTKGKSLCP